MNTFVRTDEYMTKLAIDALGGHVITDATICILYQGSKLKAFCEDTRTFVQFPRELRTHGAIFYADVVKMGGQNGTVFYRAYRKSIRRTKTGPVIQ